MLKTCPHCKNILLTDYQQRVYNGLRSRKYNSPATLAKEFGISLQNANNQLKYLVNCGLAERKTVGRYYEYYIKEK